MTTRTGAICRRRRRRRRRRDYVPPLSPHTEIIILPLDRLPRTLPPPYPPTRTHTHPTNTHFHRERRGAAAHARTHTPYTHTHTYAHTHSFLSRASTASRISPTKLSTFPLSLTASGLVADAVDVALAAG